MPRIVIGFSKIEPIRMRGFVCSKYMPSGIYKRKLNVKYGNIGKHWKLSEEQNKNKSERMKGNTNCLGKHHSEETKIKMSESHKGKPSWIKGLASELNPNWKGDDVGYWGVHKWIEKQKGKPRVCEHCGATRKEKRFHWANIDHKYRRNLDDYISLCVPCHKKYDKKNNNLNT